MREHLIAKAKALYHYAITHLVKNIYDHEILYSLGIAYYEKGDYDRAIADYTQTIRLQPDNSGAYSIRGWVYYLKGDWERAITDANEAIRLDPINRYAYNTRGNAYYLKKDYDRAVADFETALRLDPNNAEYKENLEKARKARGR